MGDIFDKVISGKDLTKEEEKEWEEYLIQMGIEAAAKWLFNKWYKEGRFTKSKSLKNG